MATKDGKCLANIEDLGCGPCSVRETNMLTMYAMKSAAYTRLYQEKTKLKMNTKIIKRYVVFHQMKAAQLVLGKGFFAVMVMMSTIQAGLMDASKIR
jgi:hypothetical protein